MFEKILVGVDGTAGGRDAIALAARLAGAQTTLTLASIYPGPVRPVEALSGELYESDSEVAEKLLEQERAAAGVQAEIAAIFAAGAARALHEWAEENQADLIVVGTSRRGIFGRVLIGDETKAALNGSPCAVAVATQGYAESPGETRIERIGVAYDQSAEALYALEVASELGADRGATVEALQVISIPSMAYMGMSGPGLGETIEDMLAEARERMAKLEGVKGDAVYGPSNEELADFSGRVDLLVVGSRGYGPTRRLVLGSTSNYLARNAHSSLLVLTRAGD